MLEAGVPLIEALPARHFAEGHLPGAINLDHDQIPAKAALLPSGRALARVGPQLPGEVVLRAIIDDIGADVLHALHPHGDEALGSSGDGRPGGARGRRASRALQA